MTQAPEQSILTVLILSESLTRDLGKRRLSFFPSVSVFAMAVSTSYKNLHNHLPPKTYCG